MVQASTYSRALLLTCSAGIALCVYAFIVEEKKSHDAKYQAACDIGEKMSCSRVLTSPYAKGFGVIRHLLGEDSPLNVPNSIPGGIMYSLLAVLSFIQRPWTAKIQVAVGVLSIVVSAYLGFILYFVLQDLCVLCVTTYAINGINLLLAYLRLRALTPAAAAAGKQKGGGGGQQHKAQKQKQNQKQKQQQQQNDKPKSPKAEKQQQQQQKKQQQSEKQQQQHHKSPQAADKKQKNGSQQQNGKVKNSDSKQKSPKTPNSKKKNN